MDDNLLSRIRTKDEAGKLIEEVDILLSSFYEQRGAGFEYALKSKIRHWVSEALSEIFSKGDADKVKFLESLKESLKNAKTLILGIAFEPTEEIIDKVSIFVRKNFDKSCLLEISYMPELMAGAVIIYEGNYIDLSIKKIFKKEFEENKQKISEKFVFNS